MSATALHFAGGLHPGQPYLLAMYDRDRRYPPRFATFSRAGDDGAAFIAEHDRLGLGTSVLIVQTVTPIFRAPDPRMDFKGCSHVAVKVTGLAKQITDALPEPTALITCPGEAFAVWKLSAELSSDKALDLAKTLASRCGGEETMYVPLPGTRRDGRPVSLVHHKKALTCDPDALGKAGNAAGVLNLTKGSEMKVEPTAWLWEGMIAVGMMVMLVGPAKMGKSTVAMDLAARMTRGLPWPDGALGGAPADVVFIENEDAESETYARAAAAGADLDRIHIQKAVVDFSIPENVAQLERVLSSLSNPRLLVVSPIVMFFGGNCRGENVREKMKPLLEMLERRGVSMIGIGHVSAGKGGKAAEDVAGPQVFQRRARNVMGVAIDTEDPNYKRNPKKAKRRLYCLGGNNARDDYDLPYRIVSAATEMAGHSSRIEWIDAAAEAELNLHEPRLSLDKPKTVEQAKAWLRSQLMDGEKTASGLETKAYEAGFGRSTFYKAMKELGVLTTRSGFQGPSMWRLP